MTSLNYNEIYSRFYTKVLAYEFLELEEEKVNEFLCNWLHSAVAQPYVRRLFTSVIMDDEIYELQCTLKNEIDEFTDKEFIVEVLALGLIIGWLTPKINNITLIAQTFGSKDEKFYSEANHLKQLQELKDSLVSEQRRLVVDRGYVWNAYLN